MPHCILPRASILFSCGTPDGIARPVGVRGNESNLLFYCLRYALVGPNGSGGDGGACSGRICGLDGRLVQAARKGVARLNSHSVAFLFCHTSHLSDLRSKGYKASNNDPRRVCTPYAATRLSHGKRLWWNHHAEFCVTRRYPSLFL